MKGKAPGQYHHDGISLPEFFEMFPDDTAAEQWFVESRWPGGVRCPACNSDNIQHRATRKPQPFRCRSCRNDFSVKTGTVMQSSNLQMQTWALAVYLLTTGIKGTASMKLHRDLRVTQKTAWHLAHRIRESWDDQAGAQCFEGPVEFDEAYFGGKEGNKHASKREHRGRGTVGKTAVAGAKDRESNQISAAVVPETTKRELQAFAFDRITEEADVFTDETGFLPRHAESHVGQSRRGRVREAAGVDERPGVVLVDDEAGLLRHLPPDEPGAPAALRQRVRGPPQPAARTIRRCRCALSSRA